MKHRNFNIKRNLNYENENCFSPRGVAAVAPSSNNMHEMQAGTK